jgi:flavorubredoxin
LPTKYEAASEVADYLTWRYNVAGEKMKPVEIADRVFWVGALDPQIRVFDILMRADNGTTYNSYLIKGNKKTALIDTVKGKFTAEFLSNVESLVALESLDYVISNHLEADHSGALPQLLEKAKNAKVVISKTAEPFLRQVLGRDAQPLKVGSGDSLDLGGKELQFVSAPFLHWPDTMLTYLTDGILFPCDFLGCHYCDDRLFDNLVGDFSYAFRYYFDVIIRPFKQYALQAIQKIESLKISMIAPSHGPILISDPWANVRKYKDWSQIPQKDGKTMLVFYASAYGATARMAQEIASSATAAGIKVSLLDVATTTITDSLSAIEAADAIVVGSPTINGDAVKPIWDLLSSLATIKVRGKIGAAFGSNAWSGEAPELLAERLKGLKFKVVEPPLKSSLSPTQEELEKCREFGLKIAEAL